MPRLLVRYGEIGLKSSSVRRRFEHELMEDIKRRHVLSRTQCVISSTRGRVFIDSDDWMKSCEILARTFGVVSFSLVQTVSSELPVLLEEALIYAEPLLANGSTFALRTRRTGNHPYTSQELAKEMGSAILERFGSRGISVSLDEPDLEIFVEVRDKDAFLFSSVLPGPGGMPLGTQGRALCVVDDDRGLASAWLMMKRGCSATVTTRNPAKLKPLLSWCPNLKAVDPEQDLSLLAKKNECIGIALSWSLHEISRKGALKGELPVFYPLVGMNEEEVSKLLGKICS